jgi:3-hydroxyphenylacetate 6-hydroxylase
LYTAFLHLIAKFRVLPPEDRTSGVIDPLRDLRDNGTFIATPRDFEARLIPREGEEELRKWLDHPNRL